MLLNGATLLSEPCPYCSGVRVMKEGHAFCSSCGREPEKKDISQGEVSKESTSTLEEILEKKLEGLSRDLEQEKNYNKQQDILKLIDSLLETLQKMKK